MFGCTIFQLTLILFFFNGNNAELTIEVTNIQKASGNLMIAVYDSKANFLTKDVVKGAKFAIKSKGSQTFGIILPYGKYGISIYHDVDGDGKLATNFMGIPKEPIGFSNNAKGFMGPPDFDKVKFDFQPQSTQQKIRLN